MKQGTRDDAAWFALGANKANGHRLTNADKARACKRALTMRPGQSNVTIAELIGVNDKTVGKYRAEMESTSELPKLDTTIGADGKSRPARREPSPAAETTTEVIDTLTGEVLDDVEIDLHRLKVRAERRAGELLGEMPLNGGDRKSELRDETVKLTDLGVSRIQSHRWQTIASIPQPDFDAALHRLDAHLHHRATGWTMSGSTCG